MTARTDSANRIVWVHQMGKVGSSAVFSALRALDSVDPVFTHMFNREKLAAYIKRKRREGLDLPEHVMASLEMRRRLQRTEDRIDLVSAVRDPMARNISAMFENLPTEFGNDPTPSKMKALSKRFLEKYPHSLPLRWFRLQVEQPLGIDVYSGSFDHEKHLQVLQAGRFRMLVLRAEDSDSLKQDAVIETLGLEGFELLRVNVGAEKQYAKLYQEFVRTFEPPEGLVKEYYESAYCSHFYTGDEIDRFRSRWAGRSSAIVAA